MSAQRVLLQRLLTNAGFLLGGNIVAAGLGLVSLALTARALGAELFGVLVLITAYVAIVDGLVNFQSWQAIIKYGADALSGNRRDDFIALVKFGSLLDVCTAALGAVAAVLTVGYVGRMQGWDPQAQQLAAYYGATILFHVAGTPIAVLRLFNRFNVMAYQAMVAAAIKLIGVATVYWLGKGLVAYLVVWAVADVLGNVFLIVMAVAELRRQSMSGVFASSITGLTSRFPGIWPFVWMTNLNGSVRLASRELDILVVFSFLGPAAVGMYKIAKQFGRVIMKTVDPLYQAIYPDLARLYAENALRDFVGFAARSAAVAGCFVFMAWLLLIPLAEPIITRTVGDEYLAARGVVLWYTGAVVIAAAAFPLQPAMLSMGKVRVTFWIHIASTVAYFGALFALLPSVGLDGAGMAYVLYYSVWVGSMLIAETTMLRRRTRQAVLIQ